MKRGKIFFLIIAVVSLYSCQSMNEAGKVAEDFLNLQNNEEYHKIVELFHPKVVDKYGEAELLRVVSYKSEIIGKDFKYEEIRKSLKSKNGDTFVGLYYKCTGDKETCYDYFFMKKTDGKFLIMEYNFNINKDALPKFEDSFKD